MMIILASFCFRRHSNILHCHYRGGGNPVLYINLNLDFFLKITTELSQIIKNDLKLFFGLDYRLHGKNDRELALSN